MRIDSWSEKHVSDSYQYQDVLTDKNGRRRGNSEEELSLVSRREEEGKRGVYHRQDACELRSSPEQRNQPGKWNQQTDSDEEPRERRGPQFVYTPLDSHPPQDQPHNNPHPNPASHPP